MISMAYTVLEAAKKLGIQKSAVLQRIRKGKLKAKKVKVMRERWEIDEKSLIENLASRINR